MCSNVYISFEIRGYGKVMFLQTSMSLFTGLVSVPGCTTGHMTRGCLSGGSLSMGDLCPGGSVQGGSLSMGISVHGGICLGGLCLGGLCPGVLCPGGPCLGVSVWGSLLRDSPTPYSNEQVVRILLECILARGFFLINTNLTIMAMLASKVFYNNWIKGLMLIVLI